MSHKFQELEFSFGEYTDTRGSLIVGEIPTGLPFEIRRWFLISGVPADSRRGEHAHRACSQMLIAINGAVTVELLYRGESAKFRLCSPDRGLLVPPMSWGVQSHFTPDAKLLVLASHEYDKSDYITNFSEFLGLTQPKF